MKAEKPVRIALIVLFFAVFLLSAALLIRDRVTAGREQQKFASLSERLEVAIRPETSAAAGERQSILPQYEAVCSENPDFGGWVRIDGTRINYPVMFTPQDPEKYLHMNFYGETSALGTPFLGAGSSILPRSDNLIVYGHHMKDGTMFAGLMKYSSRDYWKEHPIIYFSTLYEEADYEILAAFPTDVEGAKKLRCYDFIDARDEKNFDEFVSGIKAASLYDTGVTAEYGDELLTLSTCAYHAKDGRFVLVAKKIS